MSRVDLQGKLYLFFANNRKAREDLVITCHGSQLPLRTFKSGYGKFRVPHGITLYFYAPDGSKLQDPDTDRVMRGEVNYYLEVKSGEYTNDYTLFKYKEDEYVSLENEVMQYSTLMDVLTVRNRFSTNLKFGIKLSEVLQILNNSPYKHRYKRIHCSFCLVSLSGFLKGRSHNSDHNPHPFGG